MILNNKRKIFINRRITRKMLFYLVTQNFKDFVTQEILIYNNIIDSILVKNFLTMEINKCEK